MDVTADRETGPTLREAEAKYRLLVEQIPAVTYIDEVPEDDPTDLTPAYISPQLERLLGYAPHEWLADPDLWNQVTHPDDVDAAEAGSTPVVRGRQPAQHRVPDGRPRRSDGMGARGGVALS